MRQGLDSDRGPELGEPLACCILGRQGLAPKVFHGLPVFLDFLDSRADRLVARCIFIELKADLEPGGLPPLAPDRSAAGDEDGIDIGKSDFDLLAGGNGFL